MSMVSSGPNTNTATFQITLGPCPHLDGRCVVFGEVIKGLEVLDLMQTQALLPGSSGLDAVIFDCG